ncbi:MAG: hypothetical protein WD889_00225 [Candidatus Colwellbacteria bacterium]
MKSVKPEVLKVLILEDDPRIVGVLAAQFRKEPVRATIVGTAAEALRTFNSKRFSIIALDGIAPSQEGQKPSLVGPLLALAFRQMGFVGPIIGISSEPEAQELIKKGGNDVVPHRAYTCDKLELVGLIRELLNVYPTM